jgi:hypothetical protein
MRHGRGAAPTFHEVRTADPNLVTARGDRYWTKVQRFGGNFAQARYGEQAVRSS